MGAVYVGGQVGGRAGVASTTSIAFALTGGANASPQPGDLVVITSVVGSQGRNPAQAISGYTALGQLNPTAVTYDTSLNVSWKVMGALADLSFTLPSTGDVADAQRYTVQVWRGIDVAGITSASATGTATGRPNPPSITPTVVGSVVLICAGGAAATGASYTAPTNFTTNFLTGTTADTNDAMVGSGYWTGWASGAVDPAAYTGGTTNAADSWAAYTIVLPPAADVARDPITYVDSDVGGDNTVSVSSVSANAVTTIADDWDIILAASGHLSGSGAAPTLATPSGFDPREIGPSVAVVGGAINTRLHVFQRLATGSGSSATLATIGATNAAIVWTRLSYRGCDPTVPIRQVVFGNGASSTSHVIAALIAELNSRLLSFLSLGAAETATPPGSMTEREDSGTYGISSADEELSASGSTGTRTFTLGSAADSAWAMLELQGAVTSSGSPVTLTTSLAMAVQMASAATAGVAGAVQAPLQASSAVALAVAAAQTAGASLSGAVQQALSANALVQVAVQAPALANASVSAALQDARTAAAQLDAAVQQAKTLGATVDLQVQAPSEVGTSVSLMVQAGAELSAAVSVAVQSLRDASASVAMAVSQARTLAASADVAVQVGRTSSASAAAAVLQARQAGATVNMQVQGASTQSMALQAAVQFAADAAAAVSGAVSRLASSNVGLAAAISLQNTLGAAVDAYVRESTLAALGVALFVLDQGDDALESDTSRYRRIAREIERGAVDGATNNTFLKIGKRSKYRSM